jgi:hypothetical protein
MFILTLPAQQAFRTKFNKPCKILHAPPFPSATSHVQAVLLELRGAFRWLFPRHTVLGKLLHRGPQLGLVQREIVHAAYAQDAHARESGADTIHERAARVAEVVGHGVIFARLLIENGLVLTKGLQVLLSAQVLQVGVKNGEVGGVH